MKDACILHLPSTAISWILKVWMTVVKRERKRKKERKKEKEGEKEREREGHIGVNLPCSYAYTSKYPFPHLFLPDNSHINIYMFLLFLLTDSIRA